MAACVSTAPLCVEQGVVAVGLRLVPQERILHELGEQRRGVNGVRSLPRLGRESARAMPMTEW